ncbi:SDR family NAD(P)-dependent oxidoreductase [Pseudorhodoferax sp.]|uniref:SDR family NAD(P)-dependent oxidoreductase n=1 Tax=Pseudorhodoferax sp. TaxID=1993553 RepID=UPI002DD66578|nr:SDR family NAD(P)-dependent oxidoreductase [Pseudorhodoferax sp.]
MEAASAAVGSHGPLHGKVAVVTGGNGGIGKGVALQLAARGATVVINGRSAAKAEAVLAEIRALGATAHFVAGDVRDKADMDRLAAEAARLCGGVDIVVANAGGDDDQGRSTQVRAPFGDIDLQRLSAFVAQAIPAKLQPVQSLLPQLRARGGSVVFIVSEGGRTPTPGQTGMASFAGGLVMATKVLARELAKDQIRVNCVCVTVVRDSPSWTAAFERPDGVGDHHRRQYEKIIARAPLGIAAPPDIGGVVASLVSDDGRYITGSAISPTGGLTVH